MSETTITKIQEAAVVRILRLKDYSKSSHGFLGKLPRSLSAIRRNFLKQAKQLGAEDHQANQQWLDAKDVAELEFYAEE